MQRQQALPFRRRPRFDSRMTHGAPIVIETLGDLVGYGYGMNVTCSRCRHRRDLDMDALIARLVCSSCGSRRVETQIHHLDAGRRSRFVD
jgi:hypothetical protein